MLIMRSCSCGGNRNAHSRRDVVSADGVLLQLLKRHVVERASVRGFENDGWRDARLHGLPPPRRAQAPKVAGPEARKPVMRCGAGEIVSPRPREREEPGWRWRGSEEARQHGANALIRCFAGGGKGRRSLTPPSFSSKRRGVPCRSGPSCSTHRGSSPSRARHSDASTARAPCPRHWMPSRPQPSRRGQANRPPTAADREGSSHLPQQRTMPPQSPPPMRCETTVPSTAQRYNPIVRSLCPSRPLLSRRLEGP